MSRDSRIAQPQASLNAGMAEPPAEGSARTAQPPAIESKMAADAGVGSGRQTGREAGRETGGAPATTWWQGLGTLFLGRKEIDADLLEELESRLLMADVGVDATVEIIDRLTQRVSRKELTSPEALQGALQEELLELLQALRAIAGSSGGHSSLRDPDGGRERCRQDHHHRQAGAASRPRGVR